MKRREAIAGVGGLFEAGVSEGFPADRRALDPAMPIDLVLRLGPHHPSSHGALRLRLTLDGDHIVEADPLIGHLHRGAEKLFEVRDYRQGLVLANRHDWHAAFASELGLSLAVERMLGLEVPERADWLRTTFAELNRVMAHFSFIAPLLGDEPATVLDSPAYVGRECVQELMDTATGGRIHFMATRIGGVKKDVPDRWVTALKAALPQLREHLNASSRALDAQGTRDRFGGVGAITRAQVASFALSGPVARASGVNTDLRRDAPYCAYDALAAAGGLQVVTRDDGDAAARLDVVVEQCLASLDMLATCADRLSELSGSPFDVPLPKVLKVPEGSTYVQTESPSGAMGYFVVSRGDKVPWRLKLRTPSFNHVQVLRQVLVGVPVDDLVPILQSLFFVIGDLDK